MAVMIEGYIIRLKGINESEDLAKECLDSAISNNVTVSYFDGIHGENIERAQKAHGIKPWKEKMKKGRLGVKGCFLSHYTLWKKCYTSNQPYLILEHDAYFLKPLPTDILQSFDEFLMLDPYNKMRLDYKDNIENETRIGVDEYYNPYSSPKYGVTEEYAMGLQAYIIKPKAATKLINRAFNYGYLPADLQCNKGILHMQTLYPAVASINPKYWGKKGLMKSESTTQRKW